MVDHSGRLTLTVLKARLLCENTEQGWRWIYYLISILSFLSALLQLLCYFPPKFELLHQNSSRKDVLKHFDFLGLFGYAGSIVSVLLGISWGGQKYREILPVFLVPFVTDIGIFSMAFGSCVGHSYRWDYRSNSSNHMGYVQLMRAFACFNNFSAERFGKLRYPLIPVNIFRNWNFVCFSIIATVAAMIYYAISLIYPQQISILYHKSVTETGWIGVSTAQIYQNPKLNAF